MAGAFFEDGGLTYKYKQYKDLFHVTCLAKPPHQRVK
jgi:hypothetical protein